MRVYLLTHFNGDIRNTFKIFIHLKNVNYGWILNGAPSADNCGRSCPLCMETVDWMGIALKYLFQLTISDFFKYFQTFLTLIPLKNVAAIPRIRFHRNEVACRMEPALNKESP